MRNYNTLKSLARKPPDIRIIGLLSTMPISRRPKIETTLELINCQLSNIKKKKEFKNFANTVPSTT